jgi:hypothetical protein
MVVEVEEKLEKLESPPQDTEERAEELHKLTFELRRRIGMLYGDMGGWTGPPTEEQRAQMKYLSDGAKQLEPRVRDLSNVQIPTEN